MARILVADDEQDLLDIVAFRLEQEGYEVVTASDGQQALDLAREVRPDLCVLDVMMPRRTGLQVLAELRADPDLAKVKVIMLTARAGERDVERAFDHGADDYLAKPFSQAELRARVKLHLRS